MTDPAPARRRHFLDWTRILAFALLVPYHVGMYYVTWDWHIKSPAMATTLEPWMRLLSAWRMDLLFVVSGAALSCMLLKGGGADSRFLGERLRRLLVPLVFGMLVIVPPQSYLEVVQKHGYGGDYLDFLRLYLTGFGGFCGVAGQCLVLPTWNHLWYLPYLLAYTVALWCALRLRPRLLDDLARRTDAAPHGAWLFALPIAYLVATHVVLRARFPVTHALGDDWYAHSQFLALFVLGAMLARSESGWRRIEAARPLALAAALVAWAALVWLLPAAAGAGEAVRLARAVAFGVQQWCGLAAALGYAARHLDRDGPARRYLTQAVMPVYLLHQTLIVLLTHAALPWQLPPVAEGPLLIAATFATSLATYEVVRRIGWLRPLFGLRETKANPLAARAAGVVAGRAPV